MLRGPVLDPGRTSVTGRVRPWPGPAGTARSWGGPAEHVVQRAGQIVERGVVDPLAAQPVVLDERQDRGLVGGGAADVVGLGVGRDEQERQPLAVTAPVLVAAEW